MEQDLKAVRNLAKQVFEERAFLAEEITRSKVRALSKTLEQSRNLKQRDQRKVEGRIIEEGEEVREEAEEENQIM